MMVDGLDVGAMWKDGRGVRRRGRGWVVGFEVGSKSRVGSVSVGVGVGVGVSVGVGVGRIRSGRRPSDPL